MAQPCQRSMNPVEFPVDATVASATRHVRFLKLARHWGSRAATDADLPGDSAKRSCKHAWGTMIASGARASFCSISCCDRLFSVVSHSSVQKNRIASIRNNANEATVDADSHQPCTISGRTSRISFRNRGASANMSAAPYNSCMQAINGGGWKVTRKRRVRYFIQRGNVYFGTGVAQPICQQFQLQRRAKWKKRINDEQDAAVQWTFSEQLVRPGSTTA